MKKANSTQTMPLTKDELIELRWAMRDRCFDLDLATPVQAAVLEKIQRALDILDGK